MTSVVLLIVAALALAPQPKLPRVLYVTQSAGYKHPVLPLSEELLPQIGTKANAFDTTVAHDVSGITADNLKNYDAVVFYTTGELPMSEEQKAAFMEFVRGGKGFVGIHSASDTLYGWPDYGRLVGAYFKEHPWTQQASLIVENESHPAAAGLGNRFSMMEEFYTFRENPRPRVEVLVRLDASSVGSTGDYPIAWAQSFGSGRAYYNALGHFPETWRDLLFRRQIIGAIRWAAKR